MFRNVQALRALAAYAVVTHHVVFTINDYLAPGRAHLRFHSGEFGLDLFFVISGFIMAATTQEKPITASQFALRRIVRIVPMYWFFVLAATAIIAAGFRLFGGPSIEPTHVLRDLFFLPTFGANGYPQNQVVYVGWTLNYEMFFYTLVALSLLLPQRRLSLPVVCTVIAAVFLIATFFHPNPYLDYWGIPRVLEFAFGMLVWKISTRRLSPPLFAWIGVAAAALALFLIEYFQVWLAHPLLVFGIWGVSAAMIVYAAVSLEHAGRVAGAKLIQFEGDASYTIYLSHTFVLQFAAKALVLVGLTATVAGVGIAVPLLYGAVFAASAAIYLLIERPITHNLRRLVETPKRSRPGTLVPERPTGGVSP